MATLRLFASIREVAGERAVSLDGDTVGDVIDRATERFGDEFARHVPTCRVWVNGEPAELSDPVSERDEVALLPPVSGG